MGEALIVSRGSSSGGSSGKTLISQIFIENTVWKAPKIPDQNFSVRIFGGGGSAGYKSGGGGGWMNNAIIAINAGEEIQITIGEGGRCGSSSDLFGNNGGTTSFGKYLFALGGETGNGSTAGSGGSGGGAYYYGGIGFQFGGGGGTSNGGNGGKWGGGGGGYGKGGCLYENSQNTSQVTGYSGLGGNAGGWNFNDDPPANGTNTIGTGLEFEGSGICGTPDHNINEKADRDGFCGGGGYGGCGGNILYYGHSTSKGYKYNAGGGGGGYGANGGGGCEGAGGGGGYGGDGGGICASGQYNVYGGGGGYGKLGKGGGFYNIDGISRIIRDGGIAAGGCSYAQEFGNGGNGICIIQYYI